MAYIYSGYYFILNLIEVHLNMLIFIQILHHFTFNHGSANCSSKYESSNMKHLPSIACVSCLTHRVFRYQHETEIFASEGTTVRDMCSKYDLQHLGDIPINQEIAISMDEGSSLFENDDTLESVELIVNS